MLLLHATNISDVRPIVAAVTMTLSVPERASRGPSASGELLVNIQDGDSRHPENRKKN